MCMPDVERQVLRQREGRARGEKPFNGRRVRQAQEHGDVGQRAGVLEVFDEILGHVVLDAHPDEYDGELDIFADDARLAGDLRGDLVMGQAVAAEERQFLPAHERVHAVYRGNAGLDKVPRILARVRIQRLAVDVAPHAADRVGAAVRGPAQSVEDAPQHGPRDLQVQRLSQKADLRPGVAQPGGPLEDLHHGGLLHRVEHPADARGARRVGDLDHFIEADGVPRFDEQKRAVHAGDADVLQPPVRQLRRA